MCCASVSKANNRRENLVFLFSFLSNHFYYYFFLPWKLEKGFVLRLPGGHTAGRLLLAGNGGRELCKMLCYKDKQMDQAQMCVHVCAYVAPTVLMGCDVSIGRTKHAGWDRFHYPIRTSVCIHTVNSWLEITGSMSVGGTKKTPKEPSAARPVCLLCLTVIICRCDWIIRRSLECFHPQCAV